MSRDRLADAFHAHLDACQRCRDRPFDLCSSGALLLRTAATETATACEHCGGSGYEPNDTGETAFDGDPCTKCRSLSATTPETAP